jgi:hypothetical protein
MYLLWPPTVSPEADAIVTKSCLDLRAQYATVPVQPKDSRYLECAKHINDVVKALTDGTKLDPVDARQVAWRRMVEVCRSDTPLWSPGENDVPPPWRPVPPAPAQ